MRRKAFTLIEVLAAAVLLSLLAGTVLIALRMASRVSQADLTVDPTSFCRNPRDLAASVSENPAGPFKMVPGASAEGKIQHIVWYVSRVSDQRKSGERWYRLAVQPEP